MRAHRSVASHRATDGEQQGRTGKERVAGEGLVPPLPSVLPSFLPSMLPNFLPSFPPPFLPHGI